MEINLIQALRDLLLSTGFATITYQQIIMLAVSFVLLYLAIVKGFEPLLLMPIAFGMLLANLPAAGMMAPPTVEIDAVTGREKTAVGGLLWYLYQGVKLGIYPPLIFLGVGAMTDFGPLIANPKTLLLGRRLPPSASSAGPTARRPSSSPRSSPRICWGPSPWPPTPTWPSCRSSSRPSCGC
jgi:hypothetical protein